MPPAALCQTSRVQLRGEHPKAQPHPKTQARQAAVKALVAVERDGQTPGAALEAQGGPPSEGAFARELVGGVLRHRARLDETLRPFLRRPLDKLDAPVRQALRALVYERYFLDVPAQVAGDQYAGLMRALKLSSATGFVNAIARRLPPQLPPPPDAAAAPAAHLAVLHSHPQWLVERWIERLGFDECAQLCKANNRIAPLSLRVNTRRTTREQVLGWLREQNIVARPGALSPDAVLVEGGSPLGWDIWRDGLVIVQDEAAQLVGFLACPQPGQTVLDLASAPGGKATHLAQLMDDTGTVWACDVAEGRLKLVRDNAGRLGLRSIQTRQVDARAPGELPPADIVLLDAPCLGTGTLRRRPDAKWRKTGEQLQELAALQRELLDAAALQVKPQGALIYSTCSLEPEENEQQAQAFLARHPGWRIEPPSHPILGNVTTGEGWIQTWPHRHGCDGMFGVRLKREE